MKTKKTFWYGSSAALILTLVLSVLGTPGAAWSSLRDEVRQFHDFLQDHPKVSTELRANPNLVSSKRYLDKHDDLEKFLKRHPSVKREILDTRVASSADTTATIVPTGRTGNLPASFNDEGRRTACPRQVFYSLIAPFRPCLRFRNCTTGKHSSLSTDVKTRRHPRVRTGTVA